MLINQWTIIPVATASTFSLTDAAYTINIPWDRACKTTQASSFFVCKKKTCIENQVFQRR